MCELQIVFNQYFILADKGSLWDLVYNCCVSVSNQIRSKLHNVRDMHVCGMGSKMYLISFLHNICMFD